MGQYHQLVNLDKREYVHPHKLGMGLKLREQVGFEGDMGACLIALIACSNGRGGGDFEEDPVIGRWAGDRIAVVGDYAEPNDIPNVDSKELYEEVQSGKYTDVSELLLDFLLHEFKIKVKKGEGWRDRWITSYGSLANANPQNCT